MKAAHELQVGDVIRTKFEGDKSGVVPRQVTRLLLRTGLVRVWTTGKNDAHRHEIFELKPDLVLTVG